MPYAGTSEVRKAKHAAYMRKWLAENPEKHSQHLELVTANKGALLVGRWNPLALMPIIRTQR
jgi:hypothetical protein